MSGWQWFGASLLTAGCILPPGLDIGLVIAAARGMWIGATLGAIKGNGEDDDTAGSDA